MLRLLRLQLRRDRITLTIWVLGISLLVAASASAVAAEFDTEQERTQLLTLALATPSLLALRGAPNGAELGSSINFATFAFLAVLAGLMSTFLATRHGRADEERGRRELVIASPVGRTASLRATLVLGFGANLLVAAFATLGYLAAGLDAEGSITAGLALGVTGLAFLGVGVLVGELVATSRAANGIGAVVVVGAYVLRAAGDALGTPDLQKLYLEVAWPSWLSPIGWGQQVFAFTRNDLTPLLLSVGLTVITVTAALVIRSARDLGSSLLPERAGRATARATLRTDLGLAWRLQWPTLTAWTAGSAVLGLVTGSLATAVGTAVLENESIAAVLESLSTGSGDDTVGLFLGAIFGLVGVLAGAAGLQAMLRMRDEETEGRTELLLSAPLRRVTMMLDSLLIGFVSATVVVLATGAAAALSFLPVDDPDNAARAFGTALAQLPAALVFIAFAAALIGALPRVATGVAWGVFGVGVIVGIFGGLLQLPEEVQKISPIANVPAVPVDDWGPTLVLVTVALALAAAGTWAFRRRDLTT